MYIKPLCDDIIINEIYSIQKRVHMHLGMLLLRYLWLSNNIRNACK